MGFFDRFKNRNKNNMENAVSNNQPVDIQTSEIRYSQTHTGNLQVEFYDKDYDAYCKNFYDTTRLVIGRAPMNIEGHPVYNCAVSWYKEGECRMRDPKTGEFDSLSAQDYRGVWTEIDIERLQSDKDYCTMVMKELLKQKRVEDYLENGLKDEPKLPCGKYIGGVRITETGCEKFFSTTVGKASHYSDLMVNRRKEYREEAEKQRLKEIDDKKAQIARLQNEIDDMEK